MRALCDIILAPRAPSDNLVKLLVRKFIAAFLGEDQHVLGSFAGIEFAPLACIKFVPSKL